MDMLEEWTHVFRQRKPNVERLIGKRKRDDDAGRVRDDLLDERLCAQHATVLQCLASQLLSPTSSQTTEKLPALLYFYTEFLACCMSELNAHPPVPAVMTVVAAFLCFWDTTAASWLRHIPQVEIWLRLLEVLVRGFASCHQEAAVAVEAAVETRWLRAIDVLVAHLFAALALAVAPHPSSSTTGETTFLDGCLPVPRLAASVHLHVLTLLHTALSLTQRRAVVIDVGQYVALWRRSRTWLPTTTDAVLVLADDDESLIESLLALVHGAARLSAPTLDDDSDSDSNKDSDSDRQTLLHDCCAALWTFVNDVLLWDEALLVDFFSSEETAAL
eukprot:gene28696-37021_t